MVNSTSPVKLSQISKVKINLARLKSPKYFVVVGEKKEINFEKLFGSFARECVKEAGELILKHYQKKISFSLKQDFSPVTIADAKAEDYIRKKIKKKYPGHGILGEEMGIENEKSEFLWVVDPIDGTKSFLGKVPLFTTLLALLYQGKPVYGVIYQPLLNEMVWGDGHKSYFNGKPTQMRPVSHLKEAILLTTDILSIKKEQNLPHFLFLAEKVFFCRTWGDGYGYLMLATGRADIMVDPIMNFWDIMALIPVIKGAGGKISDFQGRPPENAKSIVAANAFLHEEVIQILNGKKN